MAVNKIKITVGGTDYSILAEDDAKYVKELGKELDKSFTQIMKANSRISTTQAAVLLALDYADECKKPLSQQIVCVNRSRIISTMLQVPRVRRTGQDMKPKTLKKKLKDSVRKTQDSRQSFPLFLRQQANKR